MKLLLDTHVFLWFLADDRKLPPVFKQAIEEASNDVVLSVASIWGAVIKHRLGKMPLPEPPETYLVREREQNQIGSLPIMESTMSYLAALPLLHSDPFDRLLIAQALQHNLVFLTVDAEIEAYDVKTLPR